MNKWVGRISIAALALVALSARIIAMAGEKADEFSFHNENKSEDFTMFSSVDAGITTDVDISVSEDRNYFVEEGEPGMIFNSGQRIGIDQYESSDQTLDASGFVIPLPDEDFHATAVSPVARWTLNTTVSLFDEVSREYFDVFKDLTWTCTGPIERTMNHTIPGQFPLDEVDKSTLKLEQPARGA